MAFCHWCSLQLNYGRSGKRAMKLHSKMKKHVEISKIRKKNYSLSADVTGNTTLSNPNDDSETSETTPLVPFKDRLANQEAMLLAFMAERSLPFTMAPDLIEWAKVSAIDMKVLSNMSMSRVTASHKMKFGLGKTFKEELSTELKECKFSLNLDEATSDSNKKILTILVSYFSPSKNKVIINHLASVNMLVVDGIHLEEEMDKIFKENSIDWKNLVSILMDSCNVMRGCKSGLETRIREKFAPNLLDIDGDTCHHVHNAAKMFSKTFDNQLENVIKLFYVDLRYSPDLKDLLDQICVILNITFTMPERLCPTRWMNVLDVTMDTERLFDAYTVFYFGFLSYVDKEYYRPILFS
ncbi:unnamed protein product, partial [Meganyctiphanes norvegica]